MSVPDFATLGSLGTVADLKHLLPFFPPSVSPHGPDAARAASDILERATPDDIAWLERNRPAVSEWDMPSATWWAVRPAELGEPPLAASGPATAVVALASLHPNGYVREAAVRLLASRTDGGELPYLLVRVNDWVPEVRGRALAAVRGRLSPEYAPCFVRSLALAQSLRGLRRVTHELLVDDIEARCLAAPRALVAALGSPVHALRRAAARVAVRTGDAALVMRVATARDPCVATIGARAIASAWSGDALREALPRLRRGPAHVRWAALVAACDKLPSEAEPLLREALLDPATSLRELARYRWERAGLSPLDFPAFYREAVRRAEAPATLAIALRGLAETGTAADAPLFEPFMRHDAAAVRAAAVHGLGRCGGEAYGEALLGAIDDASRRVAHDARRWARVRLGRGAVQLARPR